MLEQGANVSCFCCRKALQSAIREIESRLGKQGRVLVRPSGTEALIRVMVEAESEPLLTATMDALISRIKKEMNENR